MHTPSDVLGAASRTLTRFPAVLDSLVSELSPDAWIARPAPGEWAPVEIVCHLRDEETEDFRARVQVVVEGGDAFTPIDPERWAVDRRYRDADPAAALAAFREARSQSLAYLATVSPARLTRAVTLPSVGPLSGLDLLAAWAAHDALHLSQLSATLARIWADRWSPLLVRYAGPIPYETTARRPGSA